MLKEEYLEELIGTYIPEDEIDEFYEDITSKFNTIIDEIFQKNHEISSDKINYILINDFLNMTYTKNSTFDLLLSIESPVLEKNTEFNEKYSFKNNIKELYNGMKFLKNERKLQKKLKKRKNKKNLNTQQDIVYSNNIDTQNKPKKAYNLTQFRQNFYDKLVEKLSENTIIELDNFSIKIFSSEDIGININLYFSFFDETDDTQKIYNFKEKNYLKINPYYNYLNITEKEIKTNGISTNLIKILKTASFDIFNSYRYDRFIESFVCSLPDNIILNNISFTTLMKKVLSYLINNDLNNYKSAFSDENIYDDKYINISAYNIKVFIKEIEKYFMNNN